MLLSLAACGENASVERPADWDTEAKFLEFLNGYYSADTAEELGLYVVSGTTDDQIEYTLRSIEEALSYDNGDYPNMLEYTYDSVELEFLENYKGYEVFRVNAHSSAYEQAMQQYQESLNSDGLDPLSPSVTVVTILPIFAVTIENGRYVTSLDVAFNADIQARYLTCSTCMGQGYVSEPGDEPCTVCNGNVPEPAFICSLCNTEAINQEHQDSSDMVVGYNGGFVCPNCGNTDSFHLGLQAVCVGCMGSGFVQIEKTCTSCNGKGYLKN